VRTLTSDQQLSIDAGGTTLARILSITLLGGAVLRFADCDIDLVIGSDTYHANSGFTASAIQTAIGTDPASATFALPMNIDGIQKAAVDAGALDNSIVLFSLVDWLFPSRGSIDWFTGIVKEIKYKDDTYCELTCEPLLDPDLQINVDTFQTNCRADLGDALCTVDIDALKKTFTIVTVSNVQVFTTDLTDADAAWNNGLVVFTSGANNGLAFEIGAYTLSGGTITLQFVTPYLPTTGDTGTIYPGCDKTPANCVAYANMVNFRGEPTSIQPTAIASAGTAAS
jgi:uncharacterized phage protein (TIGR02218 family)